jgi:hypothetical protein
VSDTEPLVYYVLTEKFGSSNIDKDLIERMEKLTYKNKDRVRRTPLQTGDELMCSERVSSSCSTSGTRRLYLVTNPVIDKNNLRPMLMVDSRALEDFEGKRQFFLFYK